MITTELRDLPLTERLGLVQDLWDSIAEDQAALPVSEAQRRELDRRLAAYEKDGDPGQPATDVLANIRKRF